MKQLTFFFVLLSITFLGNAQSLSFDTVPYTLRVGLSANITGYYLSSFTFIKPHITYSYTIRRSVTVGILNDITRRSGDKYQNAQGMKIGVYAGHQWKIGGKKTTAWRLNAEAFYGQGDFLYKVDDISQDSNYYAPRAIGTIAEIQFEKRIGKQISMQIFTGIGQIWLYSSTIRQRRNMATVGITLGYYLK